MSDHSKQCICKDETVQEKYARIEEIINEYGQKEDNLLSKSKYL